MDLYGEIKDIDGVISGAISNVNALSGTVSNTKALSGILTVPSNGPQIKSYNDLSDKPQIEGVVLENNKTFRQLGLDTLSVQEIEQILYFG